MLLDSSYLIDLEETAAKAGESEHAQRFACYEAIPVGVAASAVQVSSPDMRLIADLQLLDEPARQIVRECIRTIVRMSRQNDRLQKRNLSLDLSKPKLALHRLS